MSERRRIRRAIVVGHGVAALGATLELARAKVPVLLIGRAPAVRAGSTSEHDGFAVALGEGDGDSPDDHCQETIVAGDFAANQPPVRALAAAAPRLIGALDRMGVPFGRTREGRLARDRVAGSLSRRSARAGAATAQQVLRALDAQLQRREQDDAVDARGVSIAGEPLVSRLVPWEFLGLVLDDNGVCAGVVAADLRTGKLRSFAGDAVCLASGGYGALFDRSTADVWSDGAAIARAFRRGAALANPELVHWQPTALFHADKPRALPEALRALGARVWAPRDARDPDAPSDKERDHLLERAFAGSRGLVWADDAARAIWRAERRLGESGARPRLDLAGIAADAREPDLMTTLERWLERDPCSAPIAIGAAAQASLGGLWVDYETTAGAELCADSPRSQATNLPGLYAAGSAEYQFHGANRLAGNALPASLFAGSLAARGIIAYRAALERSASELPGSLFERAESAEQELVDERLQADADAPENPFRLRRELAELLFAKCGIERNDDELDTLSGELEALAAEAARAGADGSLTHPAARQAHALPDSILLARAIVLGARHRAECRGGHHKRELSSVERRAPKTTLVVCDADGELRVLDELGYSCAGRPIEVRAEVDTSLFAPGARAMVEREP
jgi:succinate dehydrogenase / fumarate reductase flavoprotein subunit